MSKGEKPHYVIYQPKDGGVPEVTLGDEQNRPIYCDDCYHLLSTCVLCLSVGHFPTIGYVRNGYMFSLCQDCMDHNTPPSDELRDFADGLARQAEATRP